MFVFISHSGTDTWIARRIAEGCESAEAGIFLDEAQIAIGAVFETDILAALKKSDATVDSRGRTIFVADAHRDDGKRFVVRADES